MANPLVTLVEDLSPLVERELCELEALRQFLLQEQTVLLANNAEDLKLTCSEKEASVGRLERINQKKFALLDCCDLELDHLALEALSQLSTDGDNLVNEIIRSQEMSKACQRQNQINGRIIRAQESAASKLLHILRDDAHIPIYSSAGSTQGGLSSKFLGSA